MATMRKNARRSVTMMQDVDVT